MRKFLIAFCFLAASLTPTFANPPACESRDKYQVRVVAVSPVKPELEARDSEPTIFIQRGPARVRGFTQFSVYHEEAVGQRRIVVAESPPVPEWAKTGSPD